MSCNQHLRRWGASLMAWILVLSMCAGLVFPAYATTPTDAPETTQVTEATDATETTGTTGTTEVTQATDTTEVTEVTEATEATESTESTESTETTEVTEPEDLTAEEQAQAEAVLTALNALESADQVEAKLAALEEDPEGYAAYYNQALAATQAVRDAYAALNDAQKEIVGDISKLTDLDWLVPRETQDDSNKGQILETLDGDYAYISNLQITQTVTGTADFDANEGPGNDTSATDNIVRTFDTIQYSLSFSTALHKAVSDADVGGVKEGRVYFEFLVSGSEDEIIFDEGGMGWLSSYPGIQYKNCTVEIGGVSHQVLRGSYTMKPTGSNAAAIGASTDELFVVLRVLKMKNGDTIQPTFTMWLDHNDVGVTYSADDTDEALTEADLVTYKSDNCTAHDIDESKTLAVTDPVTVSATAMFNITIEGVSSQNTRVDSYDFGAESTEVINSGMGPIYGRLNGYGLLLELRGKAGQGMRGAEFPDENTPITFTVKLSTAFEPAGGSKQAEPDYLPLFWSGGGNGYLSQHPGTTVMDNINRRAVNTQESYILNVPANRNTSSAYMYRNCVDGGDWTFEKISNSEIKVTVTGFKFDTSHFPWSYYGGTETTYKYYTPSNVSNYWEIDRAVFSVGDIWVLQPYTATSGEHKGQSITEKYQTDGMFYTGIEVTDLCMKTLSQVDTEQYTTTETNPFDNTKNAGQYLMLPGTISNSVHYFKYKAYYGGRWNDSLTENAYGSDNDWATTGHPVTLKFDMQHDGCEGDFTGVAYDVLLKFDDEFFLPEGTWFCSWGSNRRYKANLLWAFKADYSGWESDEDMKAATIDDLVYINAKGDQTIAQLMAEGKVPVGMLVEIRGVVDIGMNHFQFYLDGTVRSDCPTGQVYMLTRNVYAWTKRDVAQQALDYYTDTHQDNADYTAKTITQLTDDDYNAYVWNQFPSRANGDTKILSEDHATAGMDYPKPFFRQDYYYTNETGKISNNGEAPAPESSVSRLAACEKASYSNGIYFPGIGAPIFEDSCLVTPYVVSVNKTVAQTESDGSTKEFYDMNQSQRTADYQLQVSISRAEGDGESAGAERTGVVYVEDILPADLEFLPGSAFYGGDYEQDASHKNNGSVTNGTEFPIVSDPDSEPDQDNPLLLYVTKENGQTKLLFKIWTTMDLNGVVTLPPIRYSCFIGKPSDEENDVANDDQLVNTVTAWATQDCLRPRTAQYGNLDTYTIKIIKTAAISLSKISDMLVAELTDDLGFTMNVGNNSNTPRSGTLITETLPFQGLYGTSFHGGLIVTEFSAAVLDSNGDPVTSNFQFYYTTEEAYAGWLSDDFSAQAAQEGKTLAEWLTGDAWQPLAFGGSVTEVNGLKLYPASNLPTVTGTYEDGTPKQITAIVALGDLPANTTMKLHITLDLPEGMQGDYLVNYLSQENLSCYARTQIVRRTLEGYTWLDTDMDGVQDDGEQPINGIQVTLKRLEGDTYVSVCYPGTDTPIVIHTGEQVSVLASADAITNYADGRYKFTELPAGTYRVFFESGDTDISDYTASPVHAGIDTAADSDGIPTYSNGILLNTQISDIVLSPVDQLTYGIQESRCHDSGFYPTTYYELPLTGGTGTSGFTVIGLLLTAAAILGLAPRKKKKH